MSKDQAIQISVPIVVDTGRTNFRVGYGGDRSPKSVSPTVYWKDQQDEFRYSPTLINQAVPVYSLFSESGSSSKQLTVDGHCSSMVAD